MKGYGQFKVVEKETGRQVQSLEFLYEEWLEGFSEDGCWVIDNDGSPLVIDDDGRVFRPPYGKYEAKRGTALEGGYNRIIYEGDTCVVEKRPGEFIRGKVCFGKYFSLVLVLCLLPDRIHAIGS